MSDVVGKQQKLIDLIIEADDAYADGTSSSEMIDRARAALDEALTWLPKTLRDEIYEARDEAWDEREKEG